MTNITSVGGSVIQAPPGPSGFSPAPPSRRADATAAPVLVSSESSPPDSGQVQPAAMATPSAQELHDAVSSIQSKISALSPELEFSIDKTSGRSVVTVTEQSTNNVIWQFPSEAAIEISKALDVFQKGALLHRKA